MNEDNKNDILNKIEDEIQDKKESVDYKAELLEEDSNKKNLPILIIILILVVAMLVAGGLANKNILTGKYTDIKIADISNVSKEGASEDSDVGVSFSKKKIHVDAKEIENPTGLFSFQVEFENAAKIQGKAYNFRIENKSGDEEVIVRELQNPIETNVIKPDSKGFINFNVAIDSKYNKDDLIGKKYSSSFDIVYDSIEVLDEK